MYKGSAIPQSLSLNVRLQCLMNQQRQIVFKDSLILLWNIRLLLLRALMVINSIGLLFMRDVVSLEFLWKRKSGSIWKKGLSILEGLLHI